MKLCRKCECLQPVSSFVGKTCRECRLNPRPPKGLLPIEKLLDGNRQYRFMVREARRIRSTNGVHHDVDHVIPLRGQRTRPGLVAICGLHVPSNFQVIPADVNRKSKWCSFTEADARAEEARLMALNSRSQS